MMIISILIKIGGLAGLISFIWKIVEEVQGFLKIKIEVRQNDASISILTAIENSNKISRKKIENAFIIICPEEYDLVLAGRQVAAYLEIASPINYSNDFEIFKPTEPIYIERKIGFIPLKFYYNENIAIGDEELTYSCSVSQNVLDKGNYSCRFFIFGRNRYHRSTQGLLIIAQ